MNVSAAASSYYTKLVLYHSRIRQKLFSSDGNNFSCERKILPLEERVHRNSHTTISILTNVINKNSSELNKNPSRELSLMKAFMKVGGGGCDTQTRLLIAKNHYNVAEWDCPNEVQKQREDFTI